MRNLLLLIICSIFITGGMYSNAQTNSHQDIDVVDQDSTIDVIGFSQKMIHSFIGLTKATGA